MEKVLFMLNYPTIIDQQIMDRTQADKCIEFLQHDGGCIYLEGELISINKIEFTMIEDHDKIESFEKVFGQSNTSQPLIDGILSEISAIEKNKLEEEQRQQLIENGKIARVHRVSIDTEEEKIRLKHLPKDVRDKLRKGDIVDTEGYRGIGLYYYDGTRLIKTKGEYGYFLPKEAFKMVEKHGIDFFGKSYSGAEYVIIPDEYEVFDKTEKKTDTDRAMTLGHIFEDKDYVVVNDVTYLDVSYTELY